MSIRIHDYRNRYWGHDYTLSPLADPVFARIVGWGRHLREGDLLIVARPDEPGFAAFYQVESLEYRADPPDMWFSTCRFTPVSTPLGERAIEAMAATEMVRPTTDPLACWWEFPEGNAGGEP